MTSLLILTLDVLYKLATKKDAEASQMVQQMVKSFHCIKDEYNRWRAILEEPYREFAAIK